MFSIFLIIILLFQLISGQCPSTSFCTCSPDFTILTCTYRQLTDESFLILNEQLPLSTIVLNLSSNRLTSIDKLHRLEHLQTLDLSHNYLDHLPSNLFRQFTQLSTLLIGHNRLTTLPRSYNENSNINLDLSNNPFDCTCKLKWILSWFETIHLIGQEKVTCQEPNRFHGIDLQTLKENDLCRSSLILTPKDSQIVYENDPFILNCSIHSLSNSHSLYWTLNEQFYPSNLTLSSRLSSIVTIDHLQSDHHSGIWTCHESNSTISRSISIHVLRIQSSNVCQMTSMDTSKGHFDWPRTLTGEIVEEKCPHGSAPWYSKSDANDGFASYSCSTTGQWIDLDVSQCAFRTKISRDFDRLSSEINLLNQLVIYVSKVNISEVKLDDIILLIHIIDEQQQQLNQNSNRTIEEMCMMIYRLADFILQVGCNEENQCALFFDQYRMAIGRLRSILEYLLNIADESWLYVGKQLTAMTLESPPPPTVCFVPNRPLLTIICGIANRQYRQSESRLATIQFKPPIKNQSSSSFRLIFYRQSTLYTPDPKTNDNVVIYMQPISSNNISSIQLTFYGPSDGATIGIWHSNASSWQTRSARCQIDQQNLDWTSTSCHLPTNDSTAITLLFDTKSNNDYLFFNRNYLELAVYVSSILASVCFFICILFYVCCHKVYLMPRRFFHCLINYWLSLALLLPLFAFGMRQSQWTLICQLIAITIHYLCLTTILWLTLLTYCIWRKLYMIWTGKGYNNENETDRKPSVIIVDYDDDGLPIMKLRTKPVLQFYFLAYGISFIICGINVAISREQYFSNQICFLNNFESLLSLFIPLAIFTFLLVAFLLAARINISRLTKEAIRLRNLPDEPEPEVNIPNDDDHLATSPPIETLPIIVPASGQQQTMPPADCHQSHLDSLCSSDMDHQHQPSNQIMSILFQLLLLILILISAMSMFINPLRHYHFRFEHSLYSHIYGFLVLLLAIYTLSFYVLSRSDLTTHCQYYNCCYRKKKRLPTNSYTEPPPPPQTPQLPLPVVPKENETTIYNTNLEGDESFLEHMPVPSPPHSHYSSSVYTCQVPQNSEITTLGNGTTFGSKQQATIASKYYARHRHILKTTGSASETSLQQNTKNETFPRSSPLNSVPQESVVPIEIQQQQHQCDSPYDLLLKRPIKTSLTSPIESPNMLQNGNGRFQFPSAVMSPRTFVRPSTLLISPQSQSSPSHAIIRPLPIVRLSSPNKNQILSSPSNTHTAIVNNGHASPQFEQNISNGGRSSYRIMPSPTTQERHATFVYLNSNNHVVHHHQQQPPPPPPQEKPSVWKKPPNGLPHVAYIDEDDEVSVSLKSSTCDSTSSSSSTPSPPRKDRSRSLSSSSSSSSSSSLFSTALRNGSMNSGAESNQMILHESSV